MRTKALLVLVVFIIDRLNSLIVKDFTQKIILEKILIKVSNSLKLIFNSRFFNNRYFYGGSSLTVEFRSVEPKEWVRFPPVALLSTISYLKTTNYINQKQTR